MTLAILCAGAALGCTFLAVIFACCRVSADAERRAERVVGYRYYRRIDVIT